MAIREGKWDCSYCGSTNRGRGMNCSACGRRRDPSVTFYLDDDAQEVEDQAVLKRAKSGADWTCRFCGTDNPAGEPTCRQCHAERGESESRSTRTIPIDSPAGGGPEAGTPNTGSKTGWIKVLGAAAVVVILAIIGFLIFGGREELVTVDSLRWERVVEIEAQALNRYERRESEVPAGATILGSRTAQDGTERVQVGSERVRTGSRDLGNGFFEDVYEDRPVYEERPVYVTMVEYEILEWETVRRAESSGDENTAPFWADFTLGPGEREGDRSENATLFLSSEEESYEYRIPVGEISKYPVGSRWNARIGAFGGIRSLEGP